MMIVGVVVVMVREGTFKVQVGGEKLSYDGDGLSPHRKWWCEGLCQF